MTDRSAILASLDRFIEQFALDRKSIIGHRVATQNDPMATTHQLTNRAIGQFGHFGHSKQETFDGARHEQRDSAPPPPEVSGAGLARKVLSIDGQSGQSGQSLSNQAFAGGHRENADGQSGQSILNQKVDGVRGLRSSGDAVQSDPAWWRDQYQERSRNRELVGRRSRDQAEAIAWGELQWLSHKQYGEPVAAGDLRRMPETDPGSREHPAH